MTRLTRSFNSLFHRDVKIYIAKENQRSQRSVRVSDSDPRAKKGSKVSPETELDTPAVAWLKATSDPQPIQDSRHSDDRLDEFLKTAGR